MPYNRAPCRSFLDELIELAPSRSRFGLAHKLLTPPDAHGRITRIGDFAWTRTPYNEAHHMLYGLDRTQDDYAYLSGFGSWPEAARHLDGNWLPLEMMVRLAVCTTAPADLPLPVGSGRHRGGRLDELTAVLGLVLDVDLERPDDARPYPDLDTALGVIDDYAPSFVLQCGPGLPVGWLFTEPQDPYDADQLGADLRHEVGKRFESLGYAFDSPNPVTAWCRLPGTWSVYRQCLTIPVRIGPRIEVADLHELVPVGPRRSTYSGFYIDADDPWNVGLPGKTER
jgi:hypothetical protein